MKLTIDSVSVTYSQTDDLRDDLTQEITIETGDNGNGKYYVFKTERWAFDNIEEMICLIKDFQKKMQ